MLELALDDENLDGLIGAEIRSRNEGGGHYRIDHPIGQGGMSIAFLAMQIASEGISPVVVKVPRPGYLRHGTMADLAMRKEAIALKRLNERVPPTPFVVRLIEADTLEVQVGGEPCAMPWLSIEYVHGGGEGATLDQRVRTSVARTGHAFETARAALAIECMCRGLRAVHEVGVLHRDLTPRNVLCCGFGDSEMFKIADFGIARPAGFGATFGSSIPLVGTPGYAAPEQLSPNDRLLGPWSDIFSLGCLIFYVLTGEPYFPISNMTQAITAPHRPERRRISESSALCPELSERSDLCRAIDDVLAAATSSELARRPASADVLASLLLPLLRTERPLRPPAPGRSAPDSSDAFGQRRRWSFVVKHRPRQEFVVRSAGWDGDGRCLAATTTGLAFWNGTAWESTSTDGQLRDDAVRFVHRMSAGRWLLGDDGPFLVALTTAGATPLPARAMEKGAFELGSGEIRDLAVFIDLHSERCPMLHTLCGGRWLRPLALSGLSEVTSLTRIDDERWLMTGVTPQDSGAIAIAKPTEWTFVTESIEGTARLLASAADRGRGVALAAGSSGTIVDFEGTALRSANLENVGELCAAAIDGAGTSWLGAAGELWMRRPGTESWERVWQDASWKPWISLLVDVGIVRGVTTDGAILEGRFDAVAGTAPLDLRMADYS